MGLVMLSDLEGGEVPFLKWMAIGIPMVILLIPISWYVLMRFYPPEISNIRTGIAENSQGQRPFSLDEKILSNWYPRELDVTMVALIGGIALFLPGIDVLTWGDASRSIGWEVLLMIGGVTSIGLASRDTGLTTWVVSSIFDGIAGSAPSGCCQGLGFLRF